MVRTVKSATRLGFLKNRSVTFSVLTGVAVALRLRWYRAAAAPATTTVVRRTIPAIALRRLFMACSRLAHDPQPLRVFDPDALSICFDQASLPEVLQHDVDSLARQPHEVSKIALVET